MKKFFDIFKKTDPSERFSVEELSQWPSVPNEFKKVPSLAQIEKSGGSAAQASERLREWCEAAREEGDVLEFQTVMESRYGMLTLPGLIRREKSGGFMVFYSHVGEWDQVAVGKLLDWVVKLRACDFVHSFKIEICDPRESLPVKVQEIISRRRAHRMVLSMLPYLKKQSPADNGRVFAECFGHFCNEGATLDFSLASLEKMDGWILQEVRKVKEDSFYYPLLVRFCGAFFGQVLAVETAAAWKDTGQAEWPSLFLPAEKLKPLISSRGAGSMTINPFGLISGFLRDPQGDKTPALYLKQIKSDMK
jgi:hypothetical protein